MSVSIHPGCEGGPDTFCSPLCCAKRRTALMPTSPPRRQCFISYLRSVFLQADKSVFDVHKLPAEAYAESLGLPSAPRIKVIQKDRARKEAKAKLAAETAAKASARATASSSSEDDGQEDSEDEEPSEQESSKAAASGPEPKLDAAVSGKPPRARVKNTQSKFDKMVKKESKGWCSSSRCTVRFRVLGVVISLSSGG